MTRSNTDNIDRDGFCCSKCRAPNVVIENKHQIISHTPNVHSLLCLVCAEDRRKELLNVRI